MFQVKCPRPHPTVETPHDPESEELGLPIIDWEKRGEERRETIYISSCQAEFPLSLQPSHLNINRTPSVFQD